MKTIARYQEPYKAHIARGLLESCGIDCVVLHDEIASLHSARVHPFEGICLNVHECDVDEAMKILAEDHALLPLSQKDLLEDICPHCGSARPTELFSGVSSFFSSIFYIVVFLLLKKDMWRCSVCDNVVKQS